MKSYLLVLSVIGFVGIGNAFCWAATSAKADIVNVKGEKIGTASMKQAGPDVKLTVNAKGLTEGRHGIHIHSVGKCEGPEFKSAGPHFNPHNKQHGLKNPQGCHSGDLPNLVANAKGNAKMKAVIKGVSLQEGATDSLLKTDGTALVIHAGADDEISDPAGNSGGRIACGVIKKS